MRFFYIYYVFHQYTEAYDSTGDPLHETKEVGVYSCKKNAVDAVNRFRQLVGFSNYPDDFIIQKTRCYTKGIPVIRSGDRVYSAYHEYYVKSEDYDVITRGRFCKEEDEAIKELNDWKQDPVMKQYPEGFNIIEYIVDNDVRLWSEGFNRD